MASSAGRMLGRYRLERQVGRGGMAEVWEARDQTLGRRVAVKIILPDLAADPRFHQRFLSEARAVAALEHDNVLQIYDFGESDGEPYLVMPFLDSGTLAEHLKEGEVAVGQAIDWIGQLASALDAAHAAGVLHRDVKPANVMIGAAGRLLPEPAGVGDSPARPLPGAPRRAAGRLAGRPVLGRPAQRGPGTGRAGDREHPRRSRPAPGPLRRRPVSVVGRRVGGDFVVQEAAGGS